MLSSSAQFAERIEACHEAVEHPSIRLAGYSGRTAEYQPSRKEIRILTYKYFFLLLCIIFPLRAHAATSGSHEHSNETAKPAQTTPDADHSGMDMQDDASQGEPAPSSARDPDAYADGYDFGEFGKAHMMGDQNMGGVVVNRLERAHRSAQTNSAYDITATYGHALDHAVLKAEGRAGQGRLQDARTELLWGHAIASFWDTQLGVRHDGGIGPDRSWLAFGVQGLAPYWFEVEATAYAGDNGKTALRLSADYELLLTQKLILQPRAETSLYGKSDMARDIGSGLSDALAGLRLKYEFTRQFAPYAGIEWAGKFGGTADLARAAGEKTSETRWVAGVRFWF